MISSFCLSFHPDQVSLCHCWNGRVLLVFEILDLSFEFRIIIRCKFVQILIVWNLSFVFIVGKVEGISVCESEIRFVLMWEVRQGGYREGLCGNRVCFVLEFRLFVVIHLVFILIKLFFYRLVCIFNVILYFLWWVVLFLVSILSSLFLFLKLLLKL